jgi:DNA polymerase III delta subunit
MLSLIYGTNQVAIRDFILKSAKDIKAASVKEYNLDDSTVGSVESTLQADIFGESALNVVDVSKILKAQLEKLFDLLKRYPTANVILVSTKDLDVTSPVIKIVRAFKGKIIPATLSRPKEVFRYLDDLFNKREKPCYRSLQKLLEADNDPVYILVMLQYQLRNIALAKFGLSKKLPPFQVSTAQQQARNFTESQIIDLYELLFNYDVALKTGKIVPDTVALLVTQKILAIDSQR